MRLIRGNLARGDILHNRVGIGRCHRDIHILRDAEYILEHIAEPIGMVFLKEIRLTNRQWINKALIDLQVIFLRQREIASCREIAIGRAEGPIYVSL